MKKPFLLAILASALPLAIAHDVPVHMVVTVEPLRGEEVPKLAREDVLVFQDDRRLPVTGWVPCQGERAGLELFILIDDASQTSVGSQFEDIRDFVLAQPATTSIGIGYMRNGIVETVQSLSADHDQVVAKLRLPMGGGTNPYLSLSELIRSWPRTSARREVVMLTPGHIGLDLGGESLRNLFVDAAIAGAQRAGVIVHAIYALGAGHSGHSPWLSLWAQHYLAQLAEETGGEAYSLGFGAPVSLAPYFSELSDRLKNQYWLTFFAEPGEKPGLQPIRITTEIPTAEIVAPKKVYVSGP